MTDDQFERIKKGLNFHSEGGVYNLCTLTETALREIIEDATKELETQIEKMKCCGNCKHCGEVRTYKGLDGKNIVVNCNSGRNYFCDKWEIKEK